MALNLNELFTEFHLNKFKELLNPAKLIDLVSQFYVWIQQFSGK